MKKEEELREKAISLYLQGKKIAAIARELGKSRQWVYNWLHRFESKDSDWNVSHSNAPKNIRNATLADVEKAVIDCRQRLEANPHMMHGAYAIRYDLRDRGIEAPSIATINRILRKNGLVKSRRHSYVKSGIEYPEAPSNMQIMDLIGPRYIRGGERYYLLSIISNDTRQAGVYPILSKSARDITESVVAFWKAYTVPDFLQLDNELSFKGSNRHPRGLGLLLRTALAFCVVPRFIPVSEPWRNGVVERFNQRVEETLLTQEHSCFEELKIHAAEFVEIHNSRHCYSTLGNHTPDELVQITRMPICPLDPDYEVGERPFLNCMNPNEIDFIRLVRSDCLIDVLNTKVKVDQSLMHTYVEACLMINDHTLLIRQDGKIKQVVEFPMPVQ